MTGCAPADPSGVSDTDTFEKDVAHDGALETGFSRRPIDSGNELAFQQLHEREVGAVDQSSLGTQPEIAETSTVTHADLAEAIATSKDASAWYHRERTPGELVGIWTAEDGSGHPLVFRADGTFSRSFAGGMAEGVFAMSNEGQIVTYAKRNGVGLTSHFVLDGKKLRGPRGPKPTAVWIRTTP